MKKLPLVIAVATLLASPVWATNKPDNGGSNASANSVGIGGGANVHNRNTNLNLNLNSNKANANSSSTSAASADAWGMAASYARTGDSKSNSQATGGNAFATGGQGGSSQSSAEGGQGGSSSASTGSSYAGGSASSVNNSVTVEAPDRMHYSGSYTIRNTPDAFSYAPDPTAPCIVGVGVGASGPGFGASLGGGIRDDRCSVMEIRRVAGDNSEIRRMADEYLIAELQDLRSKQTKSYSFARNQTGGFGY